MGLKLTTSGRTPTQSSHLAPGTKASEFGRSATRKSRRDLRLHGCQPYPQPIDQGREVSCLAHSFCALLYCLMCRRNLRRLPISGRVPEPKLIFLDALAKSHDPLRGISFDAALEVVRRHFGDDLDALKFRLGHVGDISAERVRDRLLHSVGVVVGYQMCGAVHDFHGTAAGCLRNGYMLPPLTAPVVSAHAVLIVGFDDDAGAFIARNSAGPGWGLEGHFFIPYDRLSIDGFFTDAASAFDLSSQILREDLLQSSSALSSK